MLSTNNITSQTVAQNSNIIFNQNQFQTNKCVTHTENSDSVNINRSGYYLVMFTASAAATTSSPSSNITFQLLSNGDVVAGAQSSAYSGGTTENASFSFTTVVAVNPSCRVVDNNQVLTVQNTGIEASVSNTNLVITRLGNLVC